MIHRIYDSCNCQLMQSEMAIVFLCNEISESEESLT